MADKNIRTCGECRWLDQNKMVTWGGKYECVKGHGNKYKNDDASRCLDREKYETRSWFRSGWYITTLIFQLLGDDPSLADVYLNIYYLKDNYLDFKPEYKEFLQEYEDIAPVICKNIMQNDNVIFWARNIMDEYLIPCAMETKNANFVKAASIYMNMFKNLKEQFINSQTLKRIK